MEKEEFIAKLHLIYAGEINALPEIVNAYENLQHQLAEKDKVINKTINFINMIKNETYQGSVEGICDTALEILERGKNVNSK